MLVPKSGGQQCGAKCPVHSYCTSIAAAGETLQPPRQYWKQHSLANILASPTELRLAAKFLCMPPTAEPNSIKSSLQHHTQLVQHAKSALLHGRGWSGVQLGNVAGLVQLQRLPSNTVVVEQGLPAECTYFIKSGEVRVVRRMEAHSPFWAALRKDPLMAAKYGPTSAVQGRCPRPTCLSLSILHWSHVFIQTARKLACWLLCLLRSMLRMPLKAAL